MRRKRMGEILLENGVLQSTALAQALDRQKRTRKLLGEILQEMGLACEKDIVRVLADQLQVSCVSSAQLNAPNPEALALIEAGTALAKLIFPFRREGTKLHLAMANPLDMATIDQLAFRTELRIVPWIAPRDEISQAIRTHYLQDTGGENHGRWRVLVVETKPVVKTTAVAALQQDGYQVFTASDGGEGLEAALRHQPHLIVTETDMPDMCGRTLFKALRNNVATRHIPVIAFSSKPTREEEIALLEMGFIDFLAKPINRDLLRARVKRVLRILKETGLGASGGKSSQPVNNGHLQDAIHLLSLALQGSSEANSPKSAPPRSPAPDPSSGKP